MTIEAVTCLVYLIITGQCYVSQARGPNRDVPRCGTERVEAVTSLDVLYNRFHEISMGIMEASDGRKSCGQLYPCPDGEPDCQTRLACLVGLVV